MRAVGNMHSLQTHSAFITVSIGPAKGGEDETKDYGRGYEDQGCQAVSIGTYF